MKSAIFITATVALMLGTSAVSAASHGNALVHSRPLNGQVFMMNQVHMSLYFYANDGLGVSNCYDACETDFPPVLLSADADLGENYALIERNDGTFQATFKDQPLYLFLNDQKPGDILGDGVEGLWRLAKP